MKKRKPEYRTLFAFNWRQRSLDGKDQNCKTQQKDKNDLYECVWKSEFQRPLH